MNIKHFTLYSLLIALLLSFVLFIPASTQGICLTLPQLQTQFDNYSNNGGDLTIDLTTCPTYVVDQPLLISYPPQAGTLTIVGLQIDDGDAKQAFVISDGPLASPPGNARVVFDNVTIRNINTNKPPGHTLDVEGAAILNQGASGEVIIRHSTLENNIAQKGGAVATINGATTRIENSTLRSNQADDLEASPDVFEHGGAVYVGAGATTHIVRSSLYNNQSRDDGGALYVANGGIVTLGDTTISGNLADERGGAIYNEAGGKVTISFSTIVCNKFNIIIDGWSNGHGIYTSVIAADVVIENSIIASNYLYPNSPPGAPVALNCLLNSQNSFSEQSIYGRIITNNSPNIITQDQDKLTIDGDFSQSKLMYTIPGLDPLLNGVHKLQADSPAIGKADCGEQVTIDQFGTPRPGPDGTCDLGSYEAPSSLLAPGQTLLYTVPVNQVITVPVEEGLAKYKNNPVNGVRFSILGNPNTAQGFLALNGDGSFVFEAKQDGKATYTIKLEDNQGFSETATLEIDVKIMPQLRTYTLSKNTLNIPADGVSLLDGLGISASGIEIIVAPSNGNFVSAPNASGHFSYQPAPGFFGDDFFAYEVVYGDSIRTLPGFVRISVEPASQALVKAVPDYYPVVRGASSYNLTSVLANDTAPAGATVEIVTQPNHGTVSGINTSNFSYTPTNPNNTSITQDWFTYRIVSSSGVSNTAQVTIEFKAPGAPTLGNALVDTLMVNSGVAGVYAINVFSPGLSDVTITCAEPSLKALIGSSATVNGAGCVYQAPAGYYGTDIFTYSVARNDNGAKTEGTVLVLVGQPYLFPPVARNYTGADRFKASFGLPFSNLLSPAYPLSQDALFSSLVYQSDDENVNIGNDGAFTYNFPTAFTGTKTFTYKICYAGTDRCSNDAVVEILVNSGPVANNITLALPLPVAPSSHNLFSLGNVSDSGNSNLTMKIVVPPTKGAYEPLFGTVSAGSIFTYTPNEFAGGLAQPGKDYAVYEVCNALNQCDAGIITINIGDDPSSSSGLVFNQQEVLLNGTTGNLNDYIKSDSGQPLVFYVTSTLVNGTLNLSADGSFTYQPNDGFTGEERIAYIAYDGKQWSEVGIVRIKVEAPSSSEQPVTPLVANNDRYPINMGEPLVRDAPGVLENDTGPQGKTLSVKGHTQPINGNLPKGIKPDGAFEYIPNPDFFGVEVIEYTLTDGDNEATAIIIISVGTDSQRPSLAVDDAYIIQVNTRLDVPAPGVLANDYGENLTVLAQEKATSMGGNVFINTDGSFSYIPVQGYTGTDTFTYQLNASPPSEKHTATVTITLTDMASLLPVTQPDFYLTPINQILQVDAPGVLANDEDGLVITHQQKATQNGFVVIKTDGAFTYTPDQGFSGYDSFKYEATRNGYTVEETVTIGVTVTTTSGPVAYPVPTNLSMSGCDGESAASGEIVCWQRPIRPTFSWTHQLSLTDTTVPGDWYQLIVTVPDGAADSFISPTSAYEFWYAAHEICQGTRCSVTPNWTMPDSNTVPASWRDDPTLRSLYNDLYSNNPSRPEDRKFTFRVRSWSFAPPAPTSALGVKPMPFGVFSGFSGDFVFEVTKPDVPQPQPHNRVTVSPGEHGFPIVSVPNWPEVSGWRIAMSGGNIPTGSIETYPHDAARCDAAQCHFLLKGMHTYLENGQTYTLQIFYLINLDWEMLTGASEASFDMPNIGPAAIVEPLTSTVNPPIFVEDQIVYEWNHAQNATWYHIWIGVPEARSTWYSEWRMATDLGCFDPFDTNAEPKLCRFSHPIIQTAPGQSYQLYIQSWGPGGFSPSPLSAEEIYNGWSNMLTSQVLPNAPVPVSINARLTERQPGYFMIEWEATPGASWYQIALWNERIASCWQQGLSSEEISQQEAINAACAVPNDTWVNDTLIWKQVPCRENVREDCNIISVSHLEWHSSQELGCHENQRDGKNYCQIIVQDKPCYASFTAALIGNHDRGVYYATLGPCMASQTLSAYNYSYGIQAWVPGREANMEWNIFNTAPSNTTP